MFTKKELSKFLEDRTATTLMIALMLAVVLVIILTAFNVRQTDIQIPLRYSGYGVTNLYRGHWYLLLSFVIFSLLTIAVNGYLSIKVHGLRRHLALGIMSFSLVILIFTAIAASAVFRLASQ